MNNTIENNRLIAIFLGYNLEIVNDEVYFTLDDMLETLSDEELHYHTNWNALMEVVQAIEEKGYVVAIKGISCAIYPLLKDKPEDYISSYVCGDLSKKIDIVYSAIIGFITWHNQQSK